MEAIAAHDIDITHTHHEDPAIPDAFHVHCHTCGWATSEHDRETAEHAADEHRAGRALITAPMTPSPV